MQWSEPIVVCCVQIWPPGEKIAESDLRVLVGRPVQRRLSIEVFIINIYTSSLKVVQRDCGVSLRSHMEHVQTEYVLGVRVCSVCDQSLYCVNVTLERGQVQGRELFRGRAGVNPSVDFVLRNFIKLYRCLNERGHFSLDTQENSYVDQVEASLVKLINKWKDFVLYFRPKLHMLRAL